jgi:hypothetical protein
MAVGRAAELVGVVVVVVVGPLLLQEVEERRLGGRAPSGRGERSVSWVGIGVVVLFSVLSSPFAYFAGVGFRLLLMLSLYLPSLAAAFDH